MENKKRGAAGEELALRYLLNKGFAFINRNARFSHKEIDLIMRDGDTIVFIEVKSRTQTRFGYGREAVHARKQARMIHAARRYLTGFPDETAARFDVVEVDLNNGRIEHIENAFDARSF